VVDNIQPRLACFMAKQAGSFSMSSISDGIIWTGNYKAEYLTSNPWPRNHIQPSRHHWHRHYSLLPTVFRNSISWYLIPSQERKHSSASIVSLPSRFLRSVIVILAAKSFRLFPWSHSKHFEVQHLLSHKFLSYSSPIKFWTPFICIHPFSLIIYLIVIGNFWCVCGA
jgi:hypothetical protein